MNEIGPALLVQMHDDLGVGVGGKPMAVALQAAAKLAEVVDLTVEDDGDGPVLVGDRLIAGDQVNDPQALDPEANAVRVVGSARVRPAVLDRRAHALQELFADGWAPGPRLAGASRP